MSKRPKKLCPFCKNKAIAKISACKDGTYCVECTWCDVSIESCENLEDAIEKWDTRPLEKESINKIIRKVNRVINSHAGSHGIIMSVHIEAIKQEIKSIKERHLG